MPAVTIKGDRVPIKLWAPAHEVDSNTIKQLRAVASLPWVAHHVAVMPDVHLGKGATVGSVVALRGAVAPAAVGVDIGCGMSAVKSDLRAEQLPDHLRGLRLALEAAIPVGGAHHAEPVWPGASPALSQRTTAHFARFKELDARAHRFEQRAACQLGSLGGGNHFVEVCLDTDGFVWLMLHSGSRHIGAELAERHMSAAQRLFHNQELPDRDLAVFLAGTPAFEAYRRDLEWAQEYASLNRDLMLERAQAVLTRTVRRHPLRGRDLVSPQLRLEGDPFR